MDLLTNRQLEVLVWIEDFISDHGYPPTRAEIADGFGWASSNAAQDHIDAIERKGYLEIDSGIARGMRVIT